MVWNLGGHFKHGMHLQRKEPLKQRNFPSHHLSTSNHKSTVTLLTLHPTMRLQFMLRLPHPFSPLLPFHCSLPTPHCMPFWKVPCLPRMRGGLDRGQLSTAPWALVCFAVLYMQSTNQQKQHYFITTFSSVALGILYWITCTMQSQEKQWFIFQGHWSGWCWHAQICGSTISLLGMKAEPGTVLLPQGCRQVTLNWLPQSVPAGAANFRGEKLKNSGAPKAHYLKEGENLLLRISSGEIKHELNTGPNPTCHMFRGFPPPL